MCSVVRNLIVQKVLKKGLRENNLVQLRCISKVYHVNDSDYSKSSERKLKIHYSHSGSAAIPEDKRQEFMSFFPDIVQGIKEKAEKYDSFGTEKHLERVLQYNIPGGKNYRGITAVEAYKFMAPKSSLTEANVKLSMYLGWCIEMFQSFNIILDDIMDESFTRRGKPCWFKVEDIGLSSINDALLVEAGIYQILKNHFSHLDCYVKLIELFHEVSFVTSIGQYLDTKTRYEDVLSFTMEKYKSIVINKTFYYTFYLPITSAMYLAGNMDLEGLRQISSILHEICYLIQIQNDILDCYGDPEIFITPGLDIQTNKCSWLAVKCLERANSVQKTIMKENYGKNDMESIWRVKQLYEELSLPEVYEIYEEETCNMLRMKIQASQRIPHEIYLTIVNKLIRHDL